MERIFRNKVVQKILAIGCVCVGLQAAFRTESKYFNRFFSILIGVYFIIRGINKFKRLISK